MLKFKPGDIVRQKMAAPIEGPILSATIVDNDHVQYEVMNPDGGSRFFREEELEDEKIAGPLNVQVLTSQDAGDVKTALGA